ncbi:MAG: excinuclease ABC subunit UvrC [Clostridia bacterium]|nr:excinuclease ABC subunit UvrC [Clostridia bacterium]
MFEDKIKKLPDSPGVYIMKNKDGKIIYIGKAKILKNRVKQYFQSSTNHSPKVKAMVQNIADFDYILCDSEMEALVLECNLIKEHTPKYNILLKDGKHYPYIKLTLNEDYPRMLFVRRIEHDGAKYFGPYPTGFGISETFDIVKEVFKIAHCKKLFPRDIGKERPCLYHSMGRCVAPCSGKITSDEYKALFGEIDKFLSGSDKELVEKLRGEMKEAAANFEFEKAALCRDKIEALRNLSEKQKVLNAKDEDMDVLAVCVEDILASVELFTIRGGKLIGSHSFDIKGEGTLDECEVLSDFTDQYYTGDVYVPKSIYLSHPIGFEDALAELLSAKRGNKVSINVPKIGDRKKIVDMALKNAKHNIEKMKTAEIKEKMKMNSLVELAEALKLEVIPDRIESYDISHTAGEENVAAMAVFKNGKPSKRDYRIFKITSVEGADDIACLKEALTRRFTHEEREKDGKFKELPDLILMDGGIAQLNCANSVLNSLGLDIPVFGMVKDDRHRTRGVVNEMGEVYLKPTGGAIRLVTYIQDEVHKTAIEFHRKRREKKMLGSELEKIDGIGEGKRKALMLYFKSIDKIKKASVEELCKVKGISERLALNIFEHFRKEN